MSKKKLLTISLAVVFAFSLYGCGGGSAPANGDGGATLRVGWTSEPDVLNPLTAYSTESLQVTNLIYEPLIGYDAALQTEYKLAESYEYSDDDLTVTYHLRHGVKWHDGEDFTADDVVGTYSFISDYEFGEAAPYTEYLEDIYAPDDYTVVMKFSEPQAFNLAYAIPILPMHIWGDMDDEDINLFANDDPIGTGPMKFVEWKQGATVTLTRNDDYYGDEPGPSKIIFILYGNEDVMAQALKAGDIDIITELAPTVWEGLSGAPNVNAVSLPGFSFHMIGMNCYGDEASGGNPMLLDKTVRQALSYAMDRAQIVEIALAGHGTPGSSLLPQGLLGWHYDVPDSDLMDGNIEKAKQMLEDAGYVDVDGDGIREKDGQKMEFRLMAIESTSVDVRAAQLFKNMAEEIGVSITLSTMDENTMGDIIFDDSPDYDMFVWGWDSDFLDPCYLLGVFLTDQIGNENDVYYSNPEFDELYSQQLIEMNPDKRKELVDEMQKIFYDDSPYLIMWYQDKLQAYRTDTFTGWVNTPGGVIYNVTYDNYINIQPVVKE